MNNLGAFAVPCFIVCIVVFALARKVPVFDAFTEGAKQGLQTTLTILPTLVGLITGVAMLQDSGALDLLANVLAPAMRALGLPPQVAPLVLMKPISGSGATAVLTQLLQKYGADSSVGRVAAVLCGSTETTLYCIAVYFGSVGVSRTRHALPAALFGDLAACLAAPLAVHLVFGK